jgi:mannose-6-phosphate isomerase-like protein (cupin superfamily)
VKQSNPVKEEVMNNKIAALCAATLALSTFAPSANAKETKGGSAAMIPAGDLKWGDVAGFPGVKMAVAEGDPAKGPTHFFIKFAGGFAAPMHHHSSDHHVTVLAGTLVLTVDGKETKLPPGSYFAFKGKKHHMTKCDAGPDCLLAVDSRGKWDVVPEGEAKAPAKAPAKK